MRTENKQNYFGLFKKPSTPAHIEALSAIFEGEEPVFAEPTPQAEEALPAPVLEIAV